MIGQPAARIRTDRDASKKPGPEVGAKPKENRPAKARPAPVAKRASESKPAQPVFEGKPAFFLGVGFTRCGTSWLHQQLTHHPHIWVPPIKELHYWTRQRRYGVWDKYYKLHFQQMRSMSRFDVRKESERNQQRFDKYLEDHGRWALRYFLGWRCDRWYRSLFPKTGYAACGEITPNYVQMTDRQMAAVHRFDPSAKIIILLRNPIDRAWSMVAKHRLRKAGDAADRAFHRVVDRTVAWPRSWVSIRLPSGPTGACWRSARTPSTTASGACPRSCAARWRASACR